MRGTLVSTGRAVKMLRRTTTVNQHGRRFRHVGRDPRAGRPSCRCNSGRILGNRVTDHGWEHLKPLTERGSQTPLRSETSRKRTDQRDAPPQERSLAQGDVSAPLSHALSGRQDRTPAEVGGPHCGRMLLPCPPIWVRPRRPTAWTRGPATVDSWAWPQTIDSTPPRKSQRRPGGTLCTR